MLKATMNVHTSFLALTQDEIDAHVDELVNEHIDGACWRT